ncbi:UDP-N-acetylglucosamine 2-epimerase (non-hydrolyzing) [Erysipelotrichaceae bacterium OttesenSCG-928-M19]|nr:UDP-N-acetylglucosamine 2-epimerase (non-hydrolyzing) [Erysipelotrichaceae bacterium OttesenSCG-928-M19]
MKAFIIFGTRPEAIKMAPLVLEMKKREEIALTVCISAQHREMLDQVLDIFEIEADYDFNIMTKGQTLADITVKVLDKFNQTIKDDRPDIVLVHGDTTTTFAAALAAFYNEVKIGHVEAGLRTYNKYSPYPEEMNRQMVGNLADLHFAPTNESKNNLLQENKDPKSIYVVGNSAIDALKYTVDTDYYHEIFEWLGNDKLILLTAHRRENLGQPMLNIFKAIKLFLKENKDYKVVYPVHLNPKIKELANSVFDENDNIKLIAPLEVVDFHNIMKKAHFILSDSGGIQEEAPSLGKPVLVLRDTTERPEGIAANTLKLVGTSFEGVYQALNELAHNKELYQKMAQASNPYGDGTTSKQITDIIINTFKNKDC